MIISIFKTFEKENCSWRIWDITSGSWRWTLDIMFWEMYIFNFHVRCKNEYLLFYLEQTRTDIDVLAGASFKLWNGICEIVVYKIFRSALINVVQKNTRVSCSYFCRRNAPQVILWEQWAAWSFVRVRSLDARCFLVLSELFISYIFSEYPGNDICSFNFLRLYNSDDFPCSFCFLNGVASSSSCGFLESFFTFNR